MNRRQEVSERKTFVEISWDRMMLRTKEAPPARHHIRDSDLDPGVPADLPRGLPCGPGAADTSSTVPASWFPRHRNPCCPRGSWVGSWVGGLAAYPRPPLACRLSPCDAGYPRGRLAAVSSRGAAFPRRNRLPATRSPTSATIRLFHITSSPTLGIEMAGMLAAVMTEVEAKSDPGIAIQRVQYLPPSPCS